MKLRIFFVASAVGLVMVTGRQGSAQEEFPYQIFERYLEPLRQQIGMPGLTALILQDGRVAWEKSYGSADVEQNTPARRDTPYAIGGVTQAVTGVLIGICVDRHALDVDDPIRTWVPAFPVAGATVRQVLAHAAEGRYRYDATNYTALTAVVEACSKKTYREFVAVEALNPLAMTRSVPGLDLARAEGAAARALFETPVLNKYLQLLTQVATPYKIDRTGKMTRSEYPSYGLDAAGGLISTAEDLANFEKAVDAGIPLSSSTLNQMWSQQTFTNPDKSTFTTPSGLGWFVQTASNVRLVWSFGHIPDAGSAMILKMPSKRLTLILLANSGGLANGYNLEQGDATSSPFVKIFLRLFI